MAVECGSSTITVLYSSPPVIVSSLVTGILDQSLRSASPGVIESAYLIAGTDVCAKFGSKDTFAC